MNSISADLKTPKSTSKKLAKTKGSWRPIYMTRNGLQSLVDPIGLEEAAWSLANQNRFNGHSDRQVTVANHLLHCLQLACLAFPLDKKLQKEALFHDVPEAFTGDVPTYCKNYRPSIKEALDSIELEILQKLGFPEGITDSRVKQIDLNALTLEAEYAFDEYNVDDWPDTQFYDDTDLLEMYTSRTPKENAIGLVAAFEYYKDF
jgi:5'-deoxynucleotidase YfbR-like HD superfamily hydrolase